MKIFLLHYTIYDGVHEHRGQALVKAKDIQTAWEIGEMEEHDAEEDNGKYWSYGDGSTASKLKDVIEISRTEAKVLSRLSVAYFIN